MNLRQFTFAVLASAIPLSAWAGSGALSLNEGDFLSAKRVLRSGGAIVSVKLSKSGKAKLRKLNGHAVGEAVHAEIAGVASDFRLREPIRGSGLEMGPYSEEDAQRVIAAINKN